jgi:hypothetical protein
LFTWRSLKSMAKGRARILPRLLSGLVQCINT